MGACVSSIRSYVKTSLAVDTGTLAVLACETSASHVHDVKHVPSILDKLCRGCYDIRYIAADKGYDSEHVHESIRASLGADAVIPVRTKTASYHGKLHKGPSGKNRKRMASSFPKDVYSRRSLIETVNSMIKRKMSDTVYGRSDKTRHVEIMCRCIAHNVRRAFDLDVI